MRWRCVGRSDHGEIETERDRVIELTTRMTGSADQIELRPLPGRHEMPARQVNPVGTEFQCHVRLAINKDACAEALNQAHSFGGEGCALWFRHSPFADLHQ